MRPNFRPPRGFVVFLCLCLLASFTLAADKKRKAARSESSSKAKSTQKVDPKAKASREVRRASDKKKKDDPRTQRLAHQKKGDDNRNQRRGKAGSSLALNKPTEKGGSKKRASTAQREADRKDQKSKLAKTTEKPDKKEVAAKKQPAEKAAKSSSKSEASSKLAKITSNPKAEIRSQAREEKGKDIPSTKFALRPVAKVMPKVELNFSLAHVMANQDAPPPRELGPDVIDVIEHDSPEVRRLDEVLRADVKAVQFSSVPNISRRKVDVGRMDAERIKQIQEALAKKGFYAGEVSGQYDDATVEAMRRFQEAQKIDVTGYATAQSLRLLGLTDWD
jgi:hypothetical protein